MKLKTTTTEALPIDNKAALALSLRLRDLAGDLKGGSELAAIITAQAPALSDVLALLERTNYHYPDQISSSELAGGCCWDDTITGYVGLSEWQLSLRITVSAPDGLMTTGEWTWEPTADLVSELREYNTAVAEFAAKCLSSRQKAREWKEYIQSRPDYDAEADREERMAQTYGDAYGY